MRKSGNKNGFTRVDHVTFDVILPTLSMAAQLVFLRIYRQTAGWNKPYDRISTSQFMAMTGIKSKMTIFKAIQELSDRDLIVVNGEERKAKEYGIKALAMPPEEN